MEEQEYFGGIGISFGKGEDVEIVVTDVEVLYGFQSSVSCFGIS